MSDIESALQRWQSASAEGDAGAMDTAAAEVLAADEAHRRTDARIEVMSAIGEAANADNEAGRREALAKLQPEHRETFLSAASAEPGEPVAEAGDDWTVAPAPREWLIPGWLPAGRMAMFTGEGAAGKSRLALQLAANIASGNPDWLAGCREKLALSEPAAVVFASWEDERDHVARLLHGMSAAATVGNRLRYVAPRGPLWEPDPEGSRHTSTTGALSAAGRWLRAYCEWWAARLLVVDPRAAAFGLNENDRALVRAFMADWDAWAQSARCAVMLISHPPKSDSAYSGSTDWHAAARAVWELGEADTDPKAKAKAMAPRLTCIKSSYAAPPGECWLKGYPGWIATEKEVAASAWKRVRDTKPTWVPPPPPK